MKIIGIGDLLIPGRYITEGFERFIRQGHQLQVFDWQSGSIEELQNINLYIERNGPNSYEIPTELLEKMKDAEVIITQFCPINSQVLSICKDLKAVGVLRGGMENIDLDLCQERNIKVFNTPGRNANAVADFTVGMILAEARNIARAHALLKEGKWIKEYTNKDSVPDLCGKTAGIVGYGAIGRKVAARLKAFDMNIVVYDPYITDRDVKLVSLEELFRTSDFVTLHSRLSKDNEKMVSYELLASMKPTAYFINMARSGLVDEDALEQVLKEGKIAGAAIDVFEQEPPGKDYKFLKYDNVTVTPHMAGSTRDAFTGSPFLLAERMEAFINGKEG